MARLLEHHALEFFAKAGIEVPEFLVVDSAQGAKHAAAELGGRVVVKALIPVGGRGKVGAIRLASSPDEAFTHAQTLIGSTVSNFPVSELLVSAQLDIVREFFASITFDSMTRQPLMLFSARGGIDIETLLEQDPKQLVQYPIRYSFGLQQFQAREIVERAGVKGTILTAIAKALRDLYQVFCELDAQTVEVNPLAATGEGRIVAPTGVIVVDDQALFRHPELEATVGTTMTNGWRPLTALERRMREIDATDAGSTIRFNEFPDGTLALMVTGGGAGFLAFDTVMRLGGNPATTFDITPGYVEEKMYLATKAVLSRPGLKGLLAGGNITNFIPIDIKVRGVMRALKELDIDTDTFPVVFRFAGPGCDAARALASELAGIEFYDADATIEEVVERILQLTADK